MSRVKNILGTRKLGTTTKSSYDWSKTKPQFEVVDNRVVEYRTLTVHEFTVYDEDPVVGAAEPLWLWERSEAGQWVMNHAVEQPTWQTVANPHTLSLTKITIVAKFSDKDATFWQLKWGSV